MRAGTLGAGVAGLTVAALVTGCGGGSDDASSQSTPPLRSGPSAAPTAPRDGTNLAACREGRCEVRVRAGDQIELAARFEAGPLVVTAVEPEHVSMRWTFEGGGAGAGEAGPNGSVMVGSGPTMLTIRVELIRSDAATVQLTPGDSS
ncbi:hypothetical protein [Actinomadura oligospora]|uniref:hypothetical protein n=1 Tax=Actinomadura oligospora TaxID=111804 RepID=UPI0004AF2BA3|nr:hypothetical protein [Actinomadura oligospora]